jgi:DNA-binding SARP family transcriptional activator
VGVGGLRVTLFGEISLERSGRSISCASTKALELVCYLLIHPGRAHDRERLSEMLWPGESGTLSKRYLRQALWKAKAALHEPLDPHPGAGDDRGRVLVASHQGQLELRPQAVEWSDVATFDAAYAGTRDTPGPQLTDAQIARLHAALGLYRSGLPANRFGAWWAAERDRLHEAHLGVLELLMESCQARRSFAQGLELGQTILRLDPSRETAHRQVMRLYHRSGRRTAAIRQYHLCVSALEQEFGIRPSAQTVELHREICADGDPEHAVPAIPAVPVQPAHAARPAGDPLAVLEARLEGIQATLRALMELIDGQNRTTRQDVR